MEGPCMQRLRCQRHSRRPSALAGTQAAQRMSSFAVRTKGLGAQLFCWLPLQQDAAPPAGDAAHAERSLFDYLFSAVVPCPFLSQGNHIRLACFPPSPSHVPFANGKIFPNGIICLPHPRPSDPFPASGRPARACVRNAWCRRYNEYSTPDPMLALRCSLSRSVHVCECVCNRD